MKTNFTPNQIKWAMQHDFVAVATSDAIYAWNIYGPSSIDGASAPEPTIEKLTNFQAFRDWAGY